MKSAPDRTPIAPTAFGLLMDPAYLRRVAGDTQAVFPHVTPEPALHGLDWSLLRARARAFRVWMFDRVAH